MEIWTNSSLPIDKVLGTESRMKGEGTNLGILMELGDKKAKIVKKKRPKSKQREKEGEFRSTLVRKNREFYPPANG